MTHDRKPQVRSVKTRSLLLEAARKVFVRDGYEKAALTDIAEMAGKTRGAIYSHFADKEEIFLTLVEHHALRRGAILQEIIAELRSTNGRNTTLYQRLIESANDAEESILFMEFQLYALRHPRLREHLADMYQVDSMVTSASSPGTVATNPDTMARARIVHIALSVVDALLIGLKLASSCMTQRAVEAIAANLMKTVIEPLSQA
jgi:AcrR family transcriptional regulator